MKRFIQTVCLLPVVLSSYLYPDSQIPKIYQSLWPDFCKDHILNDPKACSQMDETSENTYYSDDYYKGPDDDDFWLYYITNDHFFPFPLQLDLTTENLPPHLLSFLQNNDETCAYFFCSKCHQAVSKAIGMRSIETIPVYNDDELNEIWNEEYTRHNECSCYYTDTSLQELSNATNPKNPWIRCQNASVPFSYFNRCTSKYLPFLIHHLQYSELNSGCLCYWPYLSSQACIIADTLFDQIFPLLKQSEFSSLLPNYSYWEHIDTYPTHEWPEQFLKEAELRIMQNYFVFAFFYSNYYAIIMDLCNIADSHSLVSSKTLDTLYHTLSSIQPVFLNLYSTCLKQHPHPKIFYERGMIYFHQGEYFDALKDMKEFSKDMPEDVLSADFYMQEAITYAEQNLYDEAVISLTKVLQKDPLNKEAYFERATAYFELGDFENSLADYLASGLKTTSFTDNVHLALGLTAGIVQGSIEGARDLIPSLLSSLQGIGQSLWALAKDPVHISQEFISSIENCIEYVRTSTPKESLALLIPELQEFFEKESSFTAKEKGERIGCIIGKYGIEVFACVGAKKGVQLYQNLRRANNMLTLEAMKISTENQRILRLESIKRAKIRSEILKTSNLKISWDKQGKHIIGHRNFNSIERKSIFEHPDPERLALQYAGKGVKWNNTTPGVAGYQEIVNFEEFIGYCVNSETGKQTATTWGKIHYAKDGVHIVPTDPR